MRTTLTFPAELPPATGSEAGTAGAAAAAGAADDESAGTDDADATAAAYTHPEMEI